MSRIHDFNDLSKDKKNNALSSFQWHQDYGDVMFVLDNTIFGSCKDGVMITEYYLIAREPFADPARIHWDKVEDIACESMTLLINGRKTFKFNMPDEHELKTFFAELNSSLGSDDEEDDPASDAGPDPVPDAKPAARQGAANQIAPADARLLADLNQAIAAVSRGKQDRTSARELAALKFLLGIIQASRKFERNIVEGDASKYLAFAASKPKARLAIYTYAAGFTAAILKKEAGYSLDASERYYQFPFYLIYQTNLADPGASKRTIGAIASKTGGLKESSGFKTCNRDFGYFVQLIENEGNCARQYVKLVHDLLLDEMTPEEYRAISPIFDDQRCLDRLDEQLQVFEAEISDSIVDILEVFAESDEYPPLFPGVGLPVKLFFGIDEESIRPRVFIANL